MRNTRCSSGKRSFDTYDLAIEALIQHHIINEYRKGEGPINVYECNECGNWHFTSKGEVNPLFEDDATQRRIKNERRANYWERHLR